MVKKDFFTFVIILFIFLFWYSGIFVYFNLVNEKIRINNELVKVLAEINTLTNFNLSSYLKKIEILLKNNQQSSIFNFFQLENLIFQTRSFSFCFENDYYCLRSNFSSILDSCLNNKELISCLQDRFGKQYYQKTIFLENKKNDLEKRLLFLERRTKNLSFIINPFILLGNFFNPYLAQSQFLSYKEKFDLKPEVIVNQPTSSQEKVNFSYYEKIYSPSFNKVINDNKVATNFSLSILPSIVSSSENKYSTLSTSTKTEIPTTTIVATSSMKKSGGGGGNFTNDPCSDAKNRSFPKLIISEIQFETIDQKDDEFIEIYNPNIEDVDLTCWSLEKYSSKMSSAASPTLTTLIPSSKFQGRIRSRSFFLITSSSTKNKYQGDLNYPESYSLADNNVLILRYPNGQISDLVGYGSDRDKIFTFEAEPFLFKTLEGKTIQRKNFIDRDNNRRDFWLKLPTPENSSQSRSPRDDFVDLKEVLLTEFKVFITTREAETPRYFLNISFKEPQLNVSPLNYFFNLYIGTSTNLFNFNLSDFGSTTSLPQPKFDNSLVNFETEINNCPASSTDYYFNIFIKDKLDNENLSLSAISSSTFPNEFCSFSEPTSTPLMSKVLFSEIKIVEGINNNDGEYIELYNPNKFSINLTGWSIKKINKNGEIQKTSIVSSQKFKGVVIKPFSYLLLANKDVIGKDQVKADIIYPSSSSYGLTFNNGLILLTNNNQSADEICWGEINNRSNCLVNPLEGKVFLRKPGKNSTEETIKDEEKDYGNSFNSEIIKDNFLLADPEPQNSFVEEIPPAHFTKEKFSINENKIIIDFISPYQKLEKANYEIKVNDLQAENLPLLNLPLVNPYGEKERIEFNACSFGLKNNDKIFFILRENEQINYFKDFEIKDFECNPMIIKLKNKIFSYLNYYFFKVFSNRQNLLTLLLN